MSKRGQQTDYAAALEQAYKRWDHLNEHGGTDPFWPDGGSMNMIRKHIIYYKEKLAEQENSLFGLPDAYYRETPPEMNNNYMARSDEIREDARKAMEIIDADENLKFIRENCHNFSDKQLKQWCIPAIINYAESLRYAIAEDKLLEMRRYRNPKHYLESFESAANKMRMPENHQDMSNNHTIFNSDDEEAYEDVEDICEDEYAETEQQDQPDRTEQTDDFNNSSDEQPEEFIQITLF